jgi:MFS family permease
MAEQGWSRQIIAAAGVAAGTGAAQLGVGYGLGIVVWPTAPTTGDTVWLAGLAWAVWIAAGSAVLGAVAGLRVRAGNRPEVRAGALARLALVVAAAVGALLTVALIALPARLAVRNDTYSPQIVAAGYATVGIVLGLCIAWWAAASRPAAANVLATSGWLWALAVAAVVTGLLTDEFGNGVQLGNWRMTALGDRFYYGTIYWPAALLTVTAALLIGALAVWPAVRRGDRGVGAAASGAVGPLLVAAAYFTLAPQLTGARGMLESAYLVAPYTVLAGLAGSALVVALASPATNRDEVRRSTPARQTSSPTTDGQAAPTAGTADPATMKAGSTGAVRSAPPTGGPRGGPLEASGAAPDTAPSGPVKASPRQTPSDQPPVATGRAKLPTPRAESTPPPAGPPRRSTVKPPPPSPTVATINPPRPTPAGSQPGPAEPGSGPVGAATATPRKSAPPAKAAAPGAAAAASGSDDAPAPGTDGAAGNTGAKKAKAATPARKSARTKATAPVPAAGDASDNESGGEPSARTGAKPKTAGAGPNDASRAKPTSGPEAKPNNSGRAGTDRGPAAKPNPVAGSDSGTDSSTDDSSRSAGSASQDSAAGRAATRSALSAAAADPAALWVDDAEKEPESDRDGLKNRLRRFGRRPASNTTFDPDTEPPA